MRDPRTSPALIGTRAWSVSASATQTLFRECARLRAEKIVTALDRGRRADFAFCSRSAVWPRAAAGILAATMLFSVVAHAHSWYPTDCCHGADCRPVPCDELVETRNGIMWRGVVLFNDAQVKASQDQFCHVCAKEQKGSLLPYLPLCAFIQPSS
jgi:hypothetical protein